MTQTLEKCTEKKDKTDKSYCSTPHNTPITPPISETIAPNREADFKSKVKERKNKEKVTHGEITGDRYGDYVLNKEGLYYSPKEPSNDLEGEEETYIYKKPAFISSPIFPEAYLRDSNGKNHSVLLKLFDGEKYHFWAMPRQLIGNWGDLSKVFLDLGQVIPTTPLIQKKLQEFLMLAKPEKKMRCVEKGGWHDNQYVFPDGTVIGSKEGGESVYPISQIYAEGVKQSGTLKEWQDNVVSICKGNSRMIFSIGVALAAPCADLVCEESGGFNFKGRSSIGKTKCLKISISVFGSKEYMRSWKTTSNALEGTCFNHNDALLPLDEFGQSEVKDAGTTAYMISQGIGKARSRSDSTPQKSKTWRVLVISTGEVGLEEHLKEGDGEPKAGQMVRFADIPADALAGHGCFENIHGEDGGASFANKIDEACAKYYGTASREFVSLLAKDREAARTYLKYSIEDFVADHAKGCDGQVVRVARRFGLVYAALCLAEKNGILGKYLTKDEALDAVLKCYKAWLESRGTSGELESPKIVEDILGKLMEYSDSRFPLKNYDHNDDKKTYQQIWGYKEGTVFYILPKAWNKEFCGKKNRTDVAKALYNAGHFQKDKKGGFTSTVVRVASHSKELDRFYVVDIANAIEEEDSEQN